MIFLITIFLLFSCKKHDYDKYSKRWYCEELDFEFSHINIDDSYSVSISDDYLNINGKDYKVNLAIYPYSASFHFTLFSKYGLKIKYYDMIGEYYVDKDYSTMTFITKKDNLFNKYEGHKFIFKSKDITTDQLFDPSICSFSYWYSEDDKICIASVYSNNIFYFQYEGIIYPMFFSEGNKITVYDKPDGNILMLGTYSGNHRNWSIDILEKRGIFENYKNNNIMLNVGQTSFSPPIFYFSDDNYQEIVEELEKMNLE